MSDGFAAFGTLLKLGTTNTTAAVFSTIAEVGDISGPTDTVSTIDMTNHSSPGAMMEFKAGLIDPGEVSFPINWIPDDATHDHLTGLEYVKANRALRKYQITFPDGTICTFSALCTKIDRKAPVNGKLSADVTLKVSGALAWS